MSANAIAGAGPGCCSIKPPPEIMLVVYSLLQNHTLPANLLLSEHLCAPVLGDDAGCSVQLGRTWRFDIGILLCGRQFSRQVGGNFARAHQCLVACRVRAAGEVEQLAVIWKEGLNPQAVRMGMRRG